ncbi:protein-L-isoaspartate(D-aspartate) O-methyltransferase [Cupriavidus sp. UYPR2.512]|uniref:protein-L-isoaspartate(D-aspartate) O-methyltransferase n=1 Tax=Cupriavidus sp. UYPR2.512 TaxID=1080187 RepID=UPI0004767EEE|nr:protein-L-isoaspartate(D-aspartate) O-methyltransferase [Cupriavidus necator]
MTVGSLPIPPVKPSASRPSIPIATIALALFCSTTAADDALAPRRADMVKEIAEVAAAAAAQSGRHAIDARVMAVMGQVPRHEFVPDEQKPHAYENRPLPIGHGQTISQPYIVALMTDLMMVKPGDTVLEIGTGSGYQAAVLTGLARAVYTIEIIEPLGRQACDRLKRLAYRQVTCKVGDGYYGWDEHAPFDAIVVTAAASHVPPPLIRQLKPGGRMVIPVGAQFLTQYLLLVEKSADGTVSTRQILPVRFVPLVGKH